MRFRPSFIAIVLAIFSGLTFAQPPQSLQVDLSQGRFVGVPIHWGSVDGALLERSGRIRLFEQREVQQHLLLDDLFQPESLSEARIKLLAEMGPDFEAIVTGPYVIAAPRGTVDRWESRFRSLLAGYLRYFETRGWNLRKPDFPLIVIVLPDQQEFHRKANAETTARSLAINLAGMYVPRTNRCLLYQQNSTAGTDWQATEATIVHEAVHQLAYNTGVHERLFEHPLWFVEGLATMFEVPAVYDNQFARSNTTNRLHPLHHRELVERMGQSASELAGMLELIVAEDSLFRDKPDQAYALAWAMTFYLNERQPRQYFEYIGRQRSRGFTAYTIADRQADFVQSFHSTPGEMAQPILRLLNP